MNASPETRLWDLMRGALTARALGLVAELRVAESLAAGPRPIAEVASEVGADTDVLHRLLRALASDGVFAEDEEQPGSFRNTEASELLRRDGWDDFAHLFGGAFHRAAGALDPASGRPSFPKIFETDFWEWLAANVEERAAFDRAMVQGTDRRIERLAGLDWVGDETVVDVGGGNGTLMRELLLRQPSLRTIVFDLPETDRDEAAFGENCTFVAGNFFESVPVGDVYVLSTILHDWDDERATAILRTIRANAPAHARLIVIDSVVPAGNEPHGAKWLDLLMLALFGGRERDETQWRTLLGNAGFEPVRIEERLIQATCR